MCLSRPVYTSCWLLTSALAIRCGVRFGLAVEVEVFVAGRSITRSHVHSLAHSLTNTHIYSHIRSRTHSRPPACLHSLQVEVFVAGGRATAVGRDYPAAGETKIHLMNCGAESLLVKQLDVYAMGCGWL